MDRIYRLSIPGFVFLGVMALLLHTLKSVNVTDWKFGDNSYELLAVIISSPFIGYIFSTIVHFISERFWGHEFLLPTKIHRKVIKGVYPAASDSFIKAVKNKESKNLEVFYEHYQKFLRDELNQETIAWIARRWTSFYVHWNNLAAISISVIAVLLDIGGEFKLTLEPPEVLGSLILIVYVFAALRLSKISKSEAIQVEYFAVRDKIKLKKESKTI